MEKARILHVEDDAFFSNIVRMSLDVDYNGHAVVARAYTLDDAIAALYANASDKNDFNVVLLDGNLSRESQKGEDAKKIVSMIKELNLDLITIGCSGDKLMENFIEVDYELPKANFDVDKLVALLNSIDTNNR